MGPKRTCEFQGSAEPSLCAVKTEPRAHAEQSCSHANQKTLCRIKPAEIMPAVLVLRKRLACPESQRKLTVEGM